MPATSTVRHANILLRSPYILPALIALVVLGLGWWLVVAPLWPSAADDTAAQALAQTRITAQGELNSLQRITSEYRELSATDLRRLDIALPTDEDIPSLLAQLEGLVKQSGLAIAALAIDQTGAGAERSQSRVIRNEEGEVIGVSSEPPAQLSWQPSELEVNLSIAALTYPELKSFITVLEQSLKLFRVSSFTFTTGKNARGHVFNFTTPYFKLQ